MKIGLLWHSLISGNMGVRALTVANMAIVGDVARSLGIDIEFVVIGSGEREAIAINPADPQFFALTTRSTLSPRGYWRRLDDIDAVIDIGAGDSFADIYGPKRFAFLWLSKAIAITRGIPLLLAPQTIGPFDKRGYRWLAAWAMKHSHAVVARDRRSLAEAQRVAPDAQSVVSVDVAFKLPYDDQSAVRGSVKRRIGVNVSGLLFHEAESGRNRFGLSYDYAAYTRALLTALIAQPDIEVFLVPHATSVGDPTDDDGHISDRMLAEFPGVTRVGNFASASGAKSFISGLDFLVAARMHACIGAFSAGTPVFAVAYSRKFGGLFDMVDYRHVLPVEGHDSESAVTLTLTAIRNADMLKHDIDQGMVRVEVLLDAYRAQLRGLFAELGAGAHRA